METTVCIQCAIRAMLDDQPSPVFDETPEQHLRRVHPDPTATQAERRELERRLAEKLSERSPTGRSGDGR